MAAFSNFFLPKTVQLWRGYQFEMDILLYLYDESFAMSFESQSIALNSFISIEKPIFTLSVAAFLVFFVFLLSFFQFFCCNLQKITMLLSLEDHLSMNSDFEPLNERGKEHWAMRAQIIKSIDKWIRVIIRAYTTHALRGVCVWVFVIFSFFFSFTMIFDVIRLKWVFLYF